LHNLDDFVERGFGKISSDATTIDRTKIASLSGADVAASKEKPRKNRG